MDIFNITEKPEIDQLIEEYEYHSYEPITGTDLNRPGEIRMNIETQDLFTHPSESYLVFDSKLVKNADDAVYGNNDIITLTNNALMYLFSNIKYQLSGQEIESLFHPGQATTMLGLLKFPDDFQKSTGLNQLWYTDAATDASIAGNNKNNGFASIFDHCNLTNMFVMLNSRRYPEIDYDDTNFTQQKFSRVDGDAAAFRTKFYNVEELIFSPNITPSDYKELFPMFVFDVTKQSKKLKNSVTDIQIKTQFSENVPANTEAFAVVISDKSLIFQSDGQKMHVEY